MIIDLIFVVLMVLAIFKGFSRGLVVAVFSFFAIIAGLAAALKLSASLAGYLESSEHLSLKWLPFIAFIIIMAVVIIIVRLLAGIIRKSFQLLMLGWVDTIGGILLYMLIYLTVYSVILFFAEKVHMIGSEQIQASKVYSFIEPLGPKILGGIGYIIPVFKGLFTELEQFFEAIGDKIPASVQNIYLIKTNSYLA